MLISPVKSRGVYMWATYDVYEQDSTPAGTVANNLVAAATNIKNNSASSPIQKAVAEVNLKDANIKLTGLNRTGQATVPRLVSKCSTVVIFQGVSKIDTAWENAIGNKQGLKANFLQPWYNRPVRISIEGDSYLGSWNGKNISQSVSEANAANAKSGFLPSLVAGVKTGVNAAMNFVQEGMNIISNAIASAGTQNIGPFVDGTVNQLQALMSFYPHGPTGSPASDAFNIKFYLLVENEPTGKAADDYAVYQGFIERFRYHESVDKPFVQTYTLEFVGEADTIATIGTTKIQAKYDLAKMGVTTAVAANGQTITLFTLG